MPFQLHPPRSATVFRPASIRSGVAPLVVAALALLLVLGTMSGAFPAPALGSTPLAARCDGVSLRAKPATTAKLLKTLSAGVAVVAVARVSGSSWKVTCAGATTKGSTWWRITAINGRSVSSLYGVAAVYGAGALFRWTTAATVETACKGVPARTSASTTSTSRVTLAGGARLTSVGTIIGGAWKTTCTGSTVKGTTWNVISAVNGTSVKAKYGVTYLFIEHGQVRVPIVATPAPTPSPTPSPTPTPTPTPTPSPTPTPWPDPYMQGLDVSHYQGVIDWVQVAAAGKKFVFMKATQGTAYIDPTYAVNRAGAAANGLLVGAYHFADPGGATVAAAKADAIAEADHFIDAASPVAGELAPVLDLEVTNGLGPIRMKAWVVAFLNEVWYRTGVRATVYTSPAFWANGVDADGTFAPTLTAQGWSTLWIAHWTTARQPTVPGTNWGGFGWTFWQFPGGPVPGIGDGTTYKVDLDRFQYGDLAPYVITAIVPQPTPTPVPTPTPAPTPTPTPTPTLAP